MKPNCAYCGAMVTQAWGAINRAQKIGAPIYCDRTCAGFGRRKDKSIEQRKLEKRVYDKLYREKHRGALKVKKAKYFQRTYDPKSAAVERKKRMPYHVEYCRKPEYRAKKSDYDQIHRVFGTARVPKEFKEIVVLQNQLKKEIKDVT